MILEMIARETGISALDLQVIVRTASRRYKTYLIPKRNGGHRVIDQPTPQIKFLQSWVVDNVIAYLPVHPAVKSYRQGLNVSANARVHLGQNYLLKHDFSNFFPSIQSADVCLLLKENVLKIPPFLLSDTDIQVISRIVCKDGRLTIGAPSSPAISNAILYDFDERVQSKCSEMGVLYSRYADDLVFSTNTPNRLETISREVRLALDEMQSPKITINDTKTVFTSRKRLRRVTGVILTSDSKLSIGRDKKRQIRTLVYKYTCGDLPLEQISYVKGYLAYVKSVEPEFLDRLKAKYGSQTLFSLLSEPTVARK